MNLKFEFNNSKIEGAILIQSFRADDDRGYLTKDYERDIFQENGLNVPLQECFYAKSRKGIVRGNHFQRKYPQKKLVRAVCGEIYDVVVDLRKNSPTFGHYQGFYLNDENMLQLFVPEGCAHGYMVLSDLAVVSYKCSGKFYPQYDGGILWNDPDVGVSWPTGRVGEIVLSEKDKQLPTLKNFLNEHGAF